MKPAVCRDVPLNGGKSCQVGHITFIHLSLPLSLTFPVDLLILLLSFISALFIPLFYPAFNPQPHPHVSHDACVLFSFLKNPLLEGIAKTSITVSTNAYIWGFVLKY